MILGTDVLQGLGHALSVAGSMTWEILWALILGFALAAVVQAVVRKSEVVRLLGDDRPRTLAIASGLGAASSSCSVKPDCVLGLCGLEQQPLKPWRFLPRLKHVGFHA